MQSSEASSFLSRLAQISSGPAGASLNNLLQISLDDEAELCKIFTTDPTSAQLRDKYAGLIDVFEAPSCVRTTRARTVLDERDREACYVFTLPDSFRRKEGSPSIVASIADFKEAWAVFTECTLSRLADWNNVIAAGSCVLACLSPVLDEAVHVGSKTWFHDISYRSTDVELFLWGLTPEEAQNKIIAIYKAVKSTVKSDAICIRTKNFVSIHLNYPRRCIRFPLRLFSSPAEILASFSVDSTCCAYDGNRVWASPRAIIAIMRQCNTVDLARSCDSYEAELLQKSRSDGFEIYVPSLQRDRINPAPGCSSWRNWCILMSGIAIRDQGPLFVVYLDRRLFPQRKDESTSDYKYGWTDQTLKHYIHRIPLHVPYGPDWDTKRISKWIQRARDWIAPDLLNFIDIPFFSSSKMEDCLGDCCGKCPRPVDDSENKVQEVNDETCVRGSVSFALESSLPEATTLTRFKTLTEWSRAAYIHADEDLFTAVASGDRTSVSRLLHAGADISARDCVGRTALHLAIMSDTSEIACNLIDAGAQISATMIGGDNCLHLAARLSRIAVVPKLLQRSALNRQTGGTFLTKENADVLDLSAPSKDANLTALGYAVLVGSPDIVDALLAAEPQAFPRHDGLVSEERCPSPNPLALVNAIADEGLAIQIATKLIMAGASCTDMVPGRESMTIFHRAVALGHDGLVSCFLRLDPKLREVVNLPCTYHAVTASSHQYLIAVYPIISALPTHNSSLLAILIAHGAKLVFSEQEVLWVTDGKPKGRRKGAKYLTKAYMPIETAISHRNEAVHLLVSLGAELSLLTKAAAGQALPRTNTLDWVAAAAEHVSMLAAGEGESTRNFTADPVHSWKEHHAQIVFALRRSQRIANAKAMKFREDPNCAALLQDYLHETRDLLRSNGAKLREEIDGVGHSRFPLSGLLRLSSNARTPYPQDGYLLHSGRPTDQPVNEELKVLYDELYEACWNGDNAKILDMCSSSNSQVPLEISVQTTSPLSLSSQDGYTPLFVAMHRRHWDTARLIISICTAQHSHSLRASTVSGNTTQGSDSIASHPSGGSRDGSPDFMLGVSAQWPSIIDTYVEGPLLQKAIIKGDTEGFATILDLYTSSEPLSTTPDIPYFIFRHDHPEMLDEERLVHASHVYDKHGERIICRPFIWEAARFGAVNIVEYLAGSRPMEAYRQYASSVTGERAELFGDLFKKDIDWRSHLGWLVGEFNESALTAAIIFDQTDLIKKLFEYEPDEMERALRARHKFTQFNALLLCAYVGCNPSLFDYILQKDGDLYTTDMRGWNVYHLVSLSSSERHEKLLSHLLQSLDKDTTRTLLAQPSADAFNTPLHLACKRGTSANVKLLVDFGLDESHFLARDDRGCTPLHAAVFRNHHAVVRALLDAGPARAIHIENGVGQTPLDTVLQRELVSSLMRLHSIEKIEEFPLHRVPLNPLPVSPERHAVETAKLRATLDRLLGDGVLTAGTTPTNELLAFAAKMEFKAAATQGDVGARTTLAASTKNLEWDPGLTSAHILAAASARPGPRILLRLSSAQTFTHREIQRYHHQTALSYGPSTFDTLAGHVDAHIKGEKRTSLAAAREPARPVLEEPARALARQPLPAFWPRCRQAGDAEPLWRGRVVKIRKYGNRVGFGHAMRRGGSSSKFLPPVPVGRAVQKSWPSDTQVARMRSNFAPFSREVTKSEDQSPDRDCDDPLDPVDRVRRIGRRDAFRFFSDGEVHCPVHTGVLDETCFPRTVHGLCCESLIHGNGNGHPSPRVRRRPEPVATVHVNKQGFMKRALYAHREILQWRRD
ncbi:hypothetical protein EW146_g4129 [Bondarzewia mesenterica]|uniref:Uncharacterized protein n=1 Tax=Bondarzewia mesenterica TaxID=1095465 RepID=A0A4S4LVM4_9AGAM|nr:hypothetical protein EW146_g4129 [Bondarzewia mesenterica]